MEPFLFSYAYTYAYAYACVTPVHTYFSYFSYAYVHACVYMKCEPALTLCLNSSYFESRKLLDLSNVLNAEMN